MTDARRRFVHARHGDTLADVAARELPGVADAVSQLAGWNMHLSLRRQPTDEPGRLLATDIVYVEPPLP